MSRSEQLLVDFTNASITYGDGLDAGDSRKANKANRVACDAYDALQALGEEHRVLELLEFAHPAVRLMAATRALELAPEHGKVVLRSLMDGPPGAANAMAYTALTIWEKRKAA